MSDRDRTSPRIHFLDGDIEMFDTHDYLTGECLVDFEEINVRQRQANVRECFGNGERGANAVLKSVQMRRRIRNSITHPLMRGGTPTTAAFTNLPKIGSLNFFAASLLASNTAAAPSVI